MSSPPRKPSCLKQRSPEPKRQSSPVAASGSIGGPSEMLPYAQANVHFPTAKRELVKTRVTHSPASYDRSPIVVMPNSCALPARGCPGRTYDPAPVSPSGRTMHPSMTQHVRRPPTPCPVPGLVPDEGSSDDSDGLISPPPEPTHYSPPRPKSRRTSRDLRIYQSSCFGAPDEGCLGGF